MDIIIRNISIRCEIYGDYTVETVVTANADHLNAWLESTLNIYKKVGETLIVGMDTEWRLQKEADGHQKVALLQLCVSERCVLFQIYNAESIPQSLYDFLGSSSNVFVGKEVHNDAAKLWEDYGLTVFQCRDVAYTAANRFGDNELKRRRLKTLARDYLGVEMEKAKKITLSKWDRTTLTYEQIKYACLDAFVSYKLGAVLMDA